MANFMIPPATGVLAARGEVGAGAAVEAAGLVGAAEVAGA